MAKAANEKAKKAKSEPTGKEVMKRKPPSDLGLRPSRFESDPKKAYTTEQLAEIGAISTRWNQLEHTIDFICSHILFTKVPFWLKLSIDRRLSTAAKLSLLQECADNSELLDDKSKNCISDTLSHFRTYRHYRNAIVHHSIFDHEKGIGFFIDESKDAFQIMVSLEALTNLYNLICVLLEELQNIDILFRIETDAQRPIMLKSNGQTKPYPTKQLREQVIPDLRKKLARLQERRKSLPPLPKFPDADLVRALWEEQARHLDPVEKP